MLFSRPALACWLVYIKEMKWCGATGKAPPQLIDKVAQEQVAFDAVVDSCAAFRPHSWIRTGPVSTANHGGELHDSLPVHCCFRLSIIVKIPSYVSSSKRYSI